MSARVGGFTRASSLGPIAELVGDNGGRIGRALSRAGLPYAVLEKPDLVIPLREQFVLLDAAARETGDACFGARLGQAAKARNLSAFGVWVCQAATLSGAIRRANAGIAAMLQTSTVLRLERHGRLALWSIEFLEHESVGRAHNELLGLGYMMDGVRHYAGAAWRPRFVRFSGALPGSRAGHEAVLGAEIVAAPGPPAIAFDAAILGHIPEPACAHHAAHADRLGGMPGRDDLTSAVAALADLALEDGYPRAPAIAARLGLSLRTLQRRLSATGTSLDAIVEHRLERRARELLRDASRPITQIAYELGFSDPAHFTRAFRRWTGSSPSAFRRT